MDDYLCGIGDGVMITRADLKVNKRRSLWQEIVANKMSYFLLTPFVLCFILFTVLPVVVAIILSFTNFDMLGTLEFVGIKNYVRIILDDEVFMISLRNTLILALMTGPFGYVVSFGLAWLINELSPVLRTVATIAFYAPVLSGQAYTIWSYIFSSDRYGLVNGILISLGIQDTPTAWLADPKYIIPVVIIVSFWMSLGTAFLAFIAGLQGLDKSLSEAAAVDGIRNRFQELWYITLPQMLPQLLFGAVMQVISAFSVGDVSATLAGNPSPSYAGHTFLLHISDFVGARYELGYACALATILFLMMYFSNKFVSKILNSVGR